MVWNVEVSTTCSLKWAQEMVHQILSQLIFYSTLRTTLYLVTGKSGDISPLTSLTWALFEQLTICSYILLFWFKMIIFGRLLERSPSTSFSKLSSTTIVKVKSWERCPSKLTFANLYSTSKLKVRLCERSLSKLSFTKLSSTTIVKVKSWERSPWKLPSANPVSYTHLTLPTIYSV